MNDDDVLDRLARERHRLTYIELMEEDRMNRFIAAPGEHDEPDVIPGHEPNLKATRRMAWAIIGFWLAVAGWLVWLFN